MATKKIKKTLFVYVSHGSKLWLETLRKSQVGKMSKSTLVERIVQGLKNNPDVVKTIGL